VQTGRKRNWIYNSLVDYCRRSFQPREVKEMLKRKDLRTYIEGMGQMFYLWILINMLVLIRR
jgi:hypothetical protein